MATPGAFLSLSAVMLEEIAFRRYPRWFDVVGLIVFGILDNLGYRQLLAALKIRARWDVLRRRRAWGDMTRSGFASMAQEVAQRR